MLIIYQLMKQKTNIDIPLEVLELIIFFIWKPTEKHLPNEILLDIKLLYPGLIINDYHSKIITLLETTHDNDIRVMENINYFYDGDQWSIVDIINYIHKNPKDWPKMKLKTMDSYINELNGECDSEINVDLYEIDTDTFLRKVINNYHNNNGLPLHFSSLFIVSPISSENYYYLRYF